MPKQTLQPGLFDAETAAALHIEESAKASVREANRDHVGELLVAKGFAPNDFLLDLNGSLSATGAFGYPWNLPSRLMRNPVNVSRAWPGKGPRRISLAHPLMMDHPFVLRLAEETGLAIHPCEDGDHGAICHAIDLVCAGLWRDLGATRQFTADAAIFGAVRYGLEYSNHLVKSKGGYINPAEATNLMNAIGSVEPDRGSDMLSVFAEPHCESDGKSERCPINGDTSETLAWGLIYGIGQRWFAYNRGGFLNWTAAGRDAYREALGFCAPCSPMPTPRSSCSPSIASAPQ